jgi:RNA polymerase sigma-70 factor (ECF subfamily)
MPPLWRAGAYLPTSAFFAEMAKFAPRTGRWERISHELTNSGDNSVRLYYAEAFIRVGGRSMDNLDETHPSLLARIRDSRDGAAWGEFIELYSPFIYQYMRRRGLQPADAADVTQDVMRTVFCSLDGFQHAGRQGAFRKWLVTVARSRLSDWAAFRKQQAAGSGDTEILKRLAEHPMPDETEIEDEREYQQRLFRVAADSLRCKFHGSTWQAFWLTYVEGATCEEAAEQLGLSIEAVYVARGRVLRRLRQRIRELEL